MEIAEVTIKESPGLCRCCLSEGCYKDLGSEYTWMNDTEIYADMLLDCFDIGITQHNDGPNGRKRLICEVCITRLRDACNFKRQVVDSERKFIDMLGRGEFRTEAKDTVYASVPVYETPLKAEAIEEVTLTEDYESNVEYLDDMDNTEDDEPVKSEPPPVPVPSTSTSAVAKRGRPKKADSGPPEKKAKLKPKVTKLPKGEPRGGQKGKSLTKHNTAPAKIPAPGIKQAHRPEKNLAPSASVLAVKPKGLSTKEKREIMIKNVLEVLLKTTVMPFRWLKSSYRCFYCYDIFQEASDLKAHQTVHTDNTVKEKAMKNYWEPVVYVDISNMKCNLCTEIVSDLYDMVDHLVVKHHVVYNKDVGICMVAFKLNNFDVSCLVCGANFYTFGPLLNHTNKDHKGTSAILCEICGQNYKDHSLLRLHVKAAHDNSGMLCPECGDKFDTRSKLKTHQINHHGLERIFKCLVCDQTFQSHYKRSRHMATDHKNRQEIKCLHCPKMFVFRSMMMTHLRDAHLKVRNHICGVCGFKAFNSNRLKNHMYKHSGEKTVKCDGCDKTFTTRKVMKAHFARMHKAPLQPEPPVMHYNAYPHPQQ